MRIVVLAYASLLLISLLTTLYAAWAYHRCPGTRNHRPLVFPMMCGLAWCIVAVDQLLAIVGQYSSSMDGATLVFLIAVTVLALLYFVKAYVRERNKPCPLQHFPSEL